MPAQTLVFPAAEVATTDPFEAALVACRPRLFRVAVLLLRSREDAEDLTQRALLRGLEKKELFQHQSAVYTWLYRILINLAKDWRRGRGRAERVVVADAGEVEVVADEPSSEQSLLREEAIGEMQRALGQLAIHHREVLVLRHYDELSYQEMAAALDCPIGTVRSRLAAARSRLRQVIEEQRQANGGRN